MIMADGNDAFSEPAPPLGPSGAWTDPTSDTPVEDAPPEEQRRKKSHWHIDLPCGPGCGDLDAQCNLDCPDCGDVGTCCVLDLAMVFMILARVGAMFSRSGSRHGPSRPARALTRAIGLYRRQISPRIAPRCRLEPSCSTYGLAAIENHGLVTGCQMIADRLRACRAAARQGAPVTPCRRH
jgi:putative membrane protein insertion efficiency factor